MVTGGQSAILLEGYLGEYFPVYRGVRQGDVTSPLLFKIGYACWLEELEETLEGVEVYEVLHKYLAFADDTTIPYLSNQQLLLLKKLTSKEHLGKTGMRLNESKTEILPFERAKPQQFTAWKNVESAKLLGVYFQRNGDIDWKSLTKKIENRFEILKGCIRSTTTLHKVRLANTYVFSMAAHTLRIATPSKDEVAKWYTSFANYMGWKGRNKVSFRRLCIPYKYGGFGLLNMYVWGKTLKMGWINYLVCQPKETPFTRMLDNWSLQRKKEHNKIVGPLLSYEAYEDNLWPDLTREWHDVEFSIKGDRDRLEWKEDDTKGESFTNTYMCDRKHWDNPGEPLMITHLGLRHMRSTFPVSLLETGDATILRDHVIAIHMVQWKANLTGRKWHYKFTRGKRELTIYGSELQGRNGNAQKHNGIKEKGRKNKPKGPPKDFWKKAILTPFIETNTQTQYRRDEVLNAYKRLRMTRKSWLSHKIAMTVHDLLHKATKLWEEEERCWGCGEPVTAYHMLADCFWRDIVSKTYEKAWRYLTDEDKWVATSYVMWRTHIWNKYNRTRGNTHLERKKLRLQLLELETQSRVWPHEVQAATYNLYKFIIDPEQNDINTLHKEVLIDI